MQSPWQKPTVLQIVNCAGSGNIGDELMVRAFWQRLPQAIDLIVQRFAEASRQREPYPARNQYVTVPWPTPGDDVFDIDSTVSAALLVGDTPVNEDEGLDYPLRFLGPRLDALHRRSIPVDAVGAGIDGLHNEEALRMFRQSYLPIRSWTVRSPACRDALIAMGVPEERIGLGADWGWLYRPERDASGWALSTWRSLGVDPAAPLVVVNPVNMIWRDPGVKRELALALDEIRKSLGCQIAFFCNECRGGDFFDAAAVQEVRAIMSEDSVAVPPEFYSPAEAIALLASATVTVAQRYHFAVESILADAVPVCLVRGQKMISLADEFGLLRPGTVDRFESHALVEAIRGVFGNRRQWMERLREIRRKMVRRANRNLDLVARYPPYKRPLAVGVLGRIAGAIRAIGPQH
jgi:Polysaccharide pyruvyl transferase